MAKENELLTVAELSNIYKVCRSTIYRWRKQGLPCKIIGDRSIRFDSKSAEKWIETNSKSDNQKYEEYGL